jgi:hypothetical protein
MCTFFSELELLERGKDRGLTEGQTMCLYECKAVLLFVKNNIKEKKIWFAFLIEG